MISIRDTDKQRLEEVARILAHHPPKTLIKHCAAQTQIVLDHIYELSQQAPVIEPSIAPMSEADKRICYPERYA